MGNMFVQNAATKSEHLFLRTSFRPQRLLRTLSTHHEDLKQHHRSQPHLLRTRLHNQMGTRMVRMRMRTRLRRLRLFRAQVQQQGGVLHQGGARMHHKLKYSWQTSGLTSPSLALSCERWLPHFLQPSTHHQHHHHISMLSPRLLCTPWQETSHRCM